MLLKRHTYDDAIIVLTAWANQCAINTGLYTAPFSDHLAKCYCICCKVTVRVRIEGNTSSQMSTAKLK